MMQPQLLIGPMLEYAEKYFPTKEVISQTHDQLHRLTYRDIGERVRRLMSSLSHLGVEKGDRVATLAWNHHRHLELYFAAPGMGAVIHTINIRLTPQLIIDIINHAEDTILFIDEDLLSLIEEIHHTLPTVKAFVAMTDKKSLPHIDIPSLLYYEDLINTGDPTTLFRTDLNENDPAGMCYTSATTGAPKGVLYAHRGIVLHSLNMGLADCLGLSESDTTMPVVPQFHVNAWGLPFACTWFGSTQVYPGPQFTMERLASMIEDHKVTVTAGVPTIWMGLAQELTDGDYDTSSLRGVLCGGSAAPLALIKFFEEQLKIPFFHAYGSTETTPLVSFSRLKSYQENLSHEERLKERARQGLVSIGVEMRAINDDGEAIAWDDKEMGELLLRGPWIASRYYNDEARSEESFKDGWFHTQDVVTINKEGSIKIVDRMGDLIKSGGEWISSIDLENALIAHESILEACVIGIPDEKWLERPIAYVVVKENQTVTKEALFDFIRPQFPIYWLPDKIIFIDEIPKSTVGKFLKRALREQFVEDGLDS